MWTETPRLSGGLSATIKQTKKDVSPWMTITLYYIKLGIENIIYTVLISIVVSIIFITFGILICSLVSKKAFCGVESVIV